MKPHSLFWPLSASLVTLATGVGISWVYLSGLPPAVVGGPLWFVLYSLAGLVPLLLGGTMALKTLVRLKLSPLISDAWQHCRRTHWFRMIGAVMMIALGGTLSVIVGDYMEVMTDFGSMRSSLYFVFYVGVPSWVCVRLARRILGWNQWFFVLIVSVSVELVFVAAVSLVVGSVIAYLFLFEPRPSETYMSLWYIMFFVPGLLPAIWGVYVVKRLVDFDQLGSLFRRLPFITAAKRFLVGLAGSAILVALYLTSYWGTLAQQDWRSIYFASVMCAIPAALGLWAAARALKKAEPAR